MKNKKGFSTVELLVSFVIISFISISMFRAVLLLNDKLFYYQNTSRLILFNGTFTNSMTKDLLNNQIDSITVCGTNCYDITYQTLATKRLKLDNTAKTLQYGDIVQKLPLDARFAGDIAFNSQNITGISSGKKNAILSVTVPITSDVVSGDYSINVVYQYDDRLITVPIPLTSRFSAAAASASGATGTYTSKNGSNYFVGANPNNWIEFGQVSNSDTTPLMWRIIKSDNEGIKIIYEGVKNGSNAPTANGVVFTSAWDTTNSNKWGRPSTLKASLTDWYNNIYVINKNNYVQPIQWCTGAIGNGVNFPTDQIPTSNFLQYECIDGTYTGGSFSGKTSDVLPVGLIKASDYISTSSAATCTGSYSTVPANNEGSDCGILTNGTVTNFLKKTYWWPTMNTYAQNTSGLMLIRAEGGVSVANANTATGSVRPVINLKPDVSYVGGSGSLASPYKINGTTPLLASKFSASSASANGATGTYTSKNGSNYFVGANPNNWIEFGQVSNYNKTPLLWRIIKSDSEGIKIIYEGVKNGTDAPTADGRITIAGSTTTAWDTTNSSVWERPATLKALLQSWYDGLSLPNKSTYITPVKWCIGSIAWGGPTTLTTFLGSECATLTTSASAVGLIRPSDYISTSSASTCVGSYQSSGNNNGADCGKLTNGTITNFLYKTYVYWMSNPLAGYTDSVFLENLNGYIDNSYANTARGIRPVLNLNPNVSYANGDGRLINPYRLALP